MGRACMVIYSGRCLNNSLRFGETMAACGVAKSSFEMFSARS
jgi:hypothetical protein